MTEPTNRSSTSATSGQRLPPRVWKLGDFCRVWRGATLGDHDAGGYEYGKIERLPAAVKLGWAVSNIDDDVMLVGDSGREIFCQVKDLEAG